MAHAARPTVSNPGKLSGPSLPLLKTTKALLLSEKRIGQELRDERERRGKQIYDLSLTLRILPDYLAAIEEGRFEELPSRAYAIAYVGRYTRFLGLHTEKLVDRLEAEFLARGDTDEYPIEIVPLPDRELRLGPVVIGGVLLAALVYFGVYIVTFATQMQEQATERGLLQKAAPVPALVAIGQRNAIAAPEISIPLPTAIPITPAVSPAAQLLPSIQTPLPPGRQYGLRNRNSRITLRVHRPTLLEVRGVRNRRTRTYIDRALASGDSYRVPNIPGLRLTVQDAGGVEIVLDGISVGFAGAESVAERNLSLNPQSIMDRQKRG